RQVARLRRLGIAVQITLEPLLPEVTDTRSSLAPLLSALAAIGVQHISAGYLCLRPGKEEEWKGALAPLGLDEQVLAAFMDGPVLSAPGTGPARYLPRKRRQRGYANLMALAAGHDMTVSVSSTSNPDFALPRPAPLTHTGPGPLLTAFLDGRRSLRA